MLLPTNVKQTLAIRSGSVSKLIINKLPIPHVPAKPELNLTFLTMCGTKYLGLLQECLLSLYNSWSSIPKLQIVSDGTLTQSILDQALAWWPGTKSLSTSEQSISYHRQLGRESLAQFAENNILGKKLACIIEFSEQGETLWCDTDILWFKELENFPAVAENSLPILKATMDYKQSYDENLIIQGNLGHLNISPFINSGLMYIKGDILPHCNLNHLIELASKQSNWVSEQTIFAEATYQLGKNLWTTEEIICFDDDKWSLFPQYAGKPWMARHYAGPTRHLFWRDALALRLKLLKL